MGDVAIQHVPDQLADLSESATGIEWAPPDPEVLDRMLAGLRRL